MLWAKRGSWSTAAVLIFALSPVLADVPASAKVELRPLDFKGWPHANDRTGSDETDAGINRNLQKNRPWTGATAKVDWSVSKFTDTAAMYDMGLQITGESREQLLLDSRSKLEAVNRFENRLVSVTGYLGYVYSGGAEAANYQSEVFHDWHLELFQNPVIHRIQKGDETPIICEVTRFTERKLYDKGIRLQKLAAFTRVGKNGQIHYTPTGHPSHKVRITGYLFWDDGHNQPARDLGPQVTSAPPRLYHHPWRQVAWEIHPVTAIEDLGPAR